MKSLNGKELAGFIKERQATVVSSLLQEVAVQPKLLIIRDSENPVILKYVNLKKRYGEDIGVMVEDFYAKSAAEIRERIIKANREKEISGIILQLPILEKEKTDELTALISPERTLTGFRARGRLIRRRRRRFYGCSRDTTFHCRTRGLRLWGGENWSGRRFIKCLRNQITTFPFFIVATI